MAKRKEIKWRREGRGTMTGRQDGIIFRIYRAWDMPEREHTVSCHDTKGAGRTINTAGYRKFTWEEAVEFCQAIVAGEINLEDLRAEFAAEDAKRERRAIQQAVAEAKEFRGHLEQYQGVAEDVDDLKRRIGAMEARHRREDQLEEISRRQARREAEKREANRAEYREHMRKINAEKRRRKIARRRIAFLACMAILALALVCALVTACSARGSGPAEEREINGAATVSPPVTLVSAEPDMWDGEGEDPLEAEKIEEALLASGYFSIAVPMCYEYQDYMRTYCAAYECPYPLALAVAEVESHFNMEAVGAAGEVGIMQLNPGPDGAYHAELEAATGLDPTTPSGNIAAGCYLLGKYMQEYGDANKAAMAYNMGVSGAENAWAEGIASTDYSTAVVEAMERWEVTVNAWNGI